MATVEGQRFRDKVCIVTGATQGIGEGIMQVFVRHGAKVVFCGKEMDKGRGLEEELNKSHPSSAHLVSCDVRDEIQVKNMVEKTVNLYGQIDCLINNAGSHPPPQTIDEITKEGFRDLLDINLLGYFLTCKYCLPYLRQVHGSIINISSLVASIGQADALAYVATKGAVSAMTKALAIDEAKHHVRVNAVSPSNVLTPLWTSYADSCPDSQSVLAEAKDHQLLGRFGSAEEVGQLCLYLAADGTFMTGADIPLTGGAEVGYGRKTALAELPTTSKLE